MILYAWLVGNVFKQIPDKVEFHPYGLSPGLQSSLTPRRLKAQSQCTVRHQTFDEGLKQHSQADEAAQWVNEIFITGKGTCC